MSRIIYIHNISTNLACISHNVPGCMRRFFVPDKEKYEAFLRAQKNVLEQNRTKGEARLRFCGSRAAEGGEAHTILLGDVGHVFLI